MKLLVLHELCCEVGRIWDPLFFLGRWPMFDLCATLASTELHIGHHVARPKFFRSAMHSLIAPVVCLCEIWKKILYFVFWFIMAYTKNIFSFSLWVVSCRLWVVSGRQLCFALHWHFDIYDDIINKSVFASKNGRMVECERST